MATSPERAASRSRGPPRPAPKPPLEPSAWPTPAALPGTFITAMPPMADPEMKELELKAINPPYSYARISYHELKKEYLYEAIEPQLSAHEQELVTHLKSTLTRIMGAEVSTFTSGDKRTHLRGEVEEYLRSRQITLSPLSTERLVYYIQRDYVGYGPVDTLILDRQVEDISCDGLGVPLFVFHGKYESVKTNIVFNDEDTLNSFIVTLGQRCGKAVSVSSPILDGTTPEGHRVQATYLREVTTRGASFTIRRFKERPFTPVDLVPPGPPRGDDRLLLARGRAGRVAHHLRGPRGRARRARSTPSPCSSRRRRRSSRSRTPGR